MPCLASPSRAFIRLNLVSVWARDRLKYETVHRVHQLVATIVEQILQIPSAAPEVVEFIDVWASVAWTASCIRHQEWRGREGKVASEES